MAYIKTTHEPGLRREMKHPCLQNLPMGGILTWGNFCPLCGEKLAKECEDTLQRCSACNALLWWQAGYNYCTECGTKFDQGEAPSPP